MYYKYSVQSWDIFSRFHGLLPKNICKALVVQKVARIRCWPRKKGHFTQNSFASLITWDDVTKEIEAYWTNCKWGLVWRRQLREVSMPHRSCTGSSFSSTPSSPSPSSSSSCPSKQAIIKAQAPNNSKGYRNLLSYFPVDNKRSFLSYLQGISKEEKRGAEKTFRAEPQLQNEGNTKSSLFQIKHSYMLGQEPRN